MFSNCPYLNIKADTYMLSTLGALQILKSYFLNETPAGGSNLFLKLFCTDVTLSDTDTSATYTEAVGGGYGAKTLLIENFAATIEAGVAQVVYPQQLFLFTGSLSKNFTIYGYYVVDMDNVLIYSQKLILPYTPTAAGGRILLTCEFKLMKTSPIP